MHNQKDISQSSSRFFLKTDRQNVRQIKVALKTKAFGMLDSAGGENLREGKVEKAVECGRL